MDRRPTSSPAHVFVTGTTRAGTTVLRLMLGHHPQIVDTGELEWVFPPWLPVDGPASMSDLDSYRDWLRDRRNVRHSRLVVPEEGGYADIVRSLLAQRHVELGSDATVVLAVAHGAYEHVRRLFPDARFIHLSRDPRDVIASWLGFGWVGNAWAGARWWRDLQEEWAAVRAQIPEDRSREVCFEDLVQDAPKVLRELVAFLGVPYDASMLRFHESSTYEPLDPKQAFKWRRKMAPEVVRLIEAELGPSLEEWGYEATRADASPTPRWRAGVLWADDRVRRQWAKIQRFGPTLWATELVARRVGLRSLRRHVAMRMDDIVQRSVK